MKKKLRNTEYINAALKSIKVLLLFILFMAEAFAQMDTVYVPSDIPPGEGNLNNSVSAHIGNLSNIVFMLEANGYYVLTDSILVPEGEHLSIVAPEPGSTQETAPPQILISGNSYPSKYFFYSNGDITMTNIWLLYAASDGWQRQVSLQFDNSDESVLQTGIFENVLFDYSGCPQNASGAIGITSKHFVGLFKNCYFKNCVDLHLRYYGRAVSFPYMSTGNHIDSLQFENCTFANMGYAYSQEGDWIDEGQYVDNIHFNHCTFLNVIMYPLESGWWYKTSVTNSIFVNTYMYGDIPHYSGNKPYGGTIRIDSISNFGFVVPFTEQERRILFTNNCYFIEDWLVDWMANSPWAQFLIQQRREDEIPKPQPMFNNETITFFDSVDTNGNKIFPYMNKANLYESINPGLISAPTNLDAVKQFLYCKWCCGCDSNWAWKPENSFNRLWPLEEDLSYSNDTLRIAGLGSFPLGDLYHWWPTEYSQWEAQKDDEYDRIYTWLETGTDPNPDAVEELKGSLPSEYSLSQNYPNPFNSTTQIKYSIPENGLISLKVYNLLGEVVSILFEGEQRAGNYSVDFNGSKLSSGVYFYRMDANNFIETKKLVLLK